MHNGLQLHFTIERQDLTRVKNSIRAGLPYIRCFQFFPSLARLSNSNLACAICSSISPVRQMNSWFRRAKHYCNSPCIASIVNLDSCRAPLGPDVLELTVLDYSPLTPMASSISKSSSVATFAFPRSYLCSYSRLQSHSHQDQQSG